MASVSRDKKNPKHIKPNKQKKKAKNVAAETQGRTKKSFVTHSFSSAQNTPFPVSYIPFAWQWSLKTRSCHRGPGHSWRVPESTESRSGS